MMVFESAATNNKKQLENTYIIYMMIGSYFKRCRCVNSLMEKNLYLYYKEMPQSKQTKLEMAVARRFEKNFKGFYEKLGNYICDAHISRAGDNYEIFFESGFDEVFVVVYPTGEYKISGYEHV